MSLTNDGFAASPLEGWPVGRADRLFDQFIGCLRSWYVEQLTIAIGHEPPHKAVFQTEADIMNLMDAAWRKKHLAPEINRAVRAAWDGNGNAQFQPWQGWRLSGFGITNHLRALGCCLIDVEARSALAKMLGLPVDHITVGMPHPIIKPPSSSGGLLKPHVDGGVPLREVHRRTAVTDTAGAWATEYGVQVLAHLRGAQLGDGGQTLGLQGLGISEYHVMLTMLMPECRHPQAPDIPFDEVGKGIIFGDFLDTRTNPAKPSPASIFVSALNGIVRHLVETPHLPQAWLDSLPAEVRAPMARCVGRRVIKTAPIVTTEPGAYLAVWLLGFPHAAAATGKRARFTVNPNLQIGPNLQTGDRDRGCARVRNMLRGNFDAVLSDKATFQNGIVHKNVRTEVELFPHFRSMYPSVEQLDEFEQRNKEVDDQLVARKRIKLD